MQKQINFRLDFDLYTAVQRLATDRRLSISDIIRQAILEYLRKSM